MKTKLTKREIILLYLLAIVVIVGGIGYFLVIPAMNTSTELDTAIENAGLNLRFMQNTVDSESDYDESIANAKKSLDICSKSFFPAMTNDDIDKYVTGLIQKSGLVAHSLNIEELTSEETGSGLVTRKSIEVTCVGRRNGFIKLSDTIYDTPSVVLTGFSLIGSDAEGSEILDAFNISFTLQLAMYEPLPDEYFTGQAQYAATEVASDEAVEADADSPSISDYL